jgi:hypothetical protein
MIETDMLYAYVKKEDWLKPAANKATNIVILVQNLWRRQIFSSYPVSAHKEAVL